MEEQIYWEFYDIWQKVLEITHKTEKITEQICSKVTEDTLNKSNPEYVIQQFEEIVKSSSQAIEMVKQLS